MPLGTPLSGRVHTTKGPEKHRTDCHGRIVPVMRMDYSWLPPRRETRDLCVECGWTGEWWVITDAEG